MYDLALIGLLFFNTNINYILAFGVSRQSI